jgi:hypothetical protein
MAAKLSGDDHLATRISWQIEMSGEPLWGLCMTPYPSPWLRLLGQFDARAWRPAAGLRKGEGEAMRGIPNTGPL